MEGSPFSGESPASPGRRRIDGRRNAGFTLLEMMIVVVIIAILAAFAISAYSGYAVRTNRSAAEACLSEYSNYMERYYTTNLRYDEVPASGSTAAVSNPVTTTPPKLTLDCAGSSQTGLTYGYTVPAVSATAYTVKATPIGVQLTRDKQCGSLTLDQAGNRNIGTGATGTAAQCWGG